MVTSYRGPLIASLVVAGVAVYWAKPTKRTIQLFFQRLTRSPHYDASLSYEQFLDAQAAISFAKLKKNIHPDGTLPGCLVASPSRSYPDYFYEWTRDSALSYRPIVQEYINGDNKLQQFLFDFVDATQTMQRSETPSGGYRTGGLGEVKFYVDHTPFTGSWGRPQRDGPALRATLLMKFANHYLTNGGENYVKTRLFDGLDLTETVIKADLDYVSNTWSQPSFDLWEEVSGSHFYTHAVSLRAMQEGSAFAKTLGDGKSSEKYADTAKQIEKSLERFWDSQRNYLQVTLDESYNHAKDSGLDTCVILAALHNGDYKAKFAVDSPEMMSTHKAIVNSMRNVYKLNQKYANKRGAAVGRYPEDVYDGVGMSLAHAWYLCTLGHAEYLFRLANELEVKDAQVSNNLRQLSRKIPATQALITMSTPEHSALIADLRSQADEFVQVVRDFKEPDGSMAEQIDRNSGQPRGAHDLTWSYAAFLSMKAARDGLPHF